MNKVRKKITGVDLSTLEIGKMQKFCAVESGYLLPL